MRNKNPGFVRLEELAGGECRYTAGWRRGQVLVEGTPFRSNAGMDKKLVMLRGIVRKLNRTLKPGGVI